MAADGEDHGGTRARVRDRRVRIWCRATCERVEASRPELGAPVPVVVAARRPRARRDARRTTRCEVREAARRSSRRPAPSRDPAQAEGRVLVARWPRASRSPDPAGGSAGRAGRGAGPARPPRLRRGHGDPARGRASRRPGGRAGHVRRRPAAHGDRGHRPRGPVRPGLSGQTDALSGARLGRAAPGAAREPRTIAERLAYAVAFGDLSVTIAGADEEVVAAPPSAASAGG